MRITANRMLDVATQATAKAQSEVADFAAQVSSGKRVVRPSDDPITWAQARRLELRRTVAESRDQGTSLARDQLQESELALSTIGAITAEAKQLAVQAATGSLTAADRLALRDSAAGLFEAARSAANSRNVAGEYILAGARGDVQPFNAAGVYLGDGSVRSVETAEGASGVATVPGTVLTAAAGVDVLPALGRLVTALGRNDLPGIQLAMDEMETAHGQVTKAQATVGGLTVVFNDADVARGQLEDTLAARVSTLTEIDVISAASELAQRTSALEAAQAVNSRLAQLLGPH